MDTTKKGSRKTTLAKGSLALAVVLSVTLGLVSVWAGQVGQSQDVALAAAKPNSGSSCNQYDNEGKICRQCDRIDTNNLFVKNNLTVDGNATIKGDLTVKGKITGFKNPTDNKDAANKAYVDNRTDFKLTHVGSAVGEAIDCRNYPEAGYSLVSYICVMSNQNGCTSDVCMWRKNPL